MTEGRLRTGGNRTPRLHFLGRSLCAGLLAWLIVMPGCGGGGEAPALPNGGNGLTTGTVSGRLIVPPNNMLESEPNNTLAAAQAVTESSVVSGSAAQGDPGFALPDSPEERVQDLYALTGLDRTQITLTIAENDLDAADLDLFLLDASGEEIDASQSSLSTEIVETPEAGTYIVGVQAYSGSSAYVLSFAPLGSLPVHASPLVPAGARFVPGEILVKRKSAAGSASPAVLSQGLEQVASYPDGVELLRVSPSGSEGAAATAATLAEETLEQIRRLREDPSVVYAEPNYLRRASLTPNDDAYPFQWHYGLINLPQAWDLTTGSDEVVVAVIDSGVLLGHPDLQGRLTDGYDFIRDPAISNDGDGMDPDPNDPGDDPEGHNSSFHGTHVAGTVGAATNNSIGVAGSTWHTRVMPLRALGVDGGTDADIAQAIRYAAGLSNASGTLPDQPADVINMSFGATGFSRTLQDAVRAARNRGVMLVAAAGNENTSDPHYPAALDEVISVSAVDLNSQKAPYSNFGSTVDVAAPGGNTSVDLNGDRLGDGVLSTLGDDEGHFTYRLYQGTSMAAPHVAGVLALMLAANPGLTPDDVDQLLAGTHPETSIRITRDLGSPGRDDVYGYGLVDAAQAVVAAQSVPGGGGPTPDGSVLAVSTTSLNFENYLESLAFEVSNAGIGDLEILEIRTEAPWLSVTPAEGTAPLGVTARVDRSGLAAGVRNASIEIVSDATVGEQTATVTVQMAVGGVTVGNVGNVFVLVLDPDTFETVDQAVTNLAAGYRFRTPRLPPGSYRLLAGTDLDDDNLICDIEDACGFWPDPVTVQAGRNTGPVDFVLGVLASPQQEDAPAEDLPAGPFRRLR